VIQSQVWVEDQDEKRKLIEQYKSNLRWGTVSVSACYEATFPSQHHHLTSEDHHLSSHHHNLTSDRHHLTSHYNLISCLETFGMHLPGASPSVIIGSISQVSETAKRLVPSPVRVWEQD